MFIIELGVEVPYEVTKIHERHMQLLVWNAELEMLNHIKTQVSQEDVKYSIENIISNVVKPCIALGGF